MLDPEADQAWVRVDSSGQLLGDRFQGTCAELREHLVRSVRDVPPACTSRDATVWIHPLSTSVRCRLVVMELPWGTYRWIQEPPESPPPRRGWLAGLLHP